MHGADFERAQQHALERLERELALELVYHSARHTRDEVLPAVDRLATMEGICEEQCRLLRTAAAYHDIGFIEQYADHEAAGIRIASATLPRFGFDPDQIQIVGDIIRATKLPQSPRNLLEQIMADADLDMLGRDDFFIRNADLRAEQAMYGRPATDTEWYSQQIAFLAAHVYFTASARAWRGATKQRNLARLQERLNACRGEHG